MDLENQWALAWDDSEVHGARARVFDEKLGEVDGDRTVGFDALVADNDEPGGKLPRGLNEWVADL